MKAAKAAKLPPITLVRRADTHRLIPAQYGDAPDGALGRLSEDERELSDLIDLSRATDARPLAENGRLPAISIHELVFGVPHWAVINSAFAYAHPLGSRFNGPDRGAWYASFQLPTAQSEVAFHKAVHLAEVGRYEDEVHFDDYLADFNAEFHDLRRARSFIPCLDPKKYSVSQGLAEKLLEKGSLGVVYPSVRRRRGTCIACFEPALVSNVRMGKRYRFRWTGKAAPHIEPVTRR